MSITLTLTLFFVLLALTAFFNLAEMALIEARRSAFQAASEGAASIVLALKKRPGLFLAAIRTGDLVTDLLIGAFVVTAIDHHVSEWLKSVPIIGDYAAIVAGIGAFAIVSYISLVLTDLAPKSIALSSPAIRDNGCTSAEPCDPLDPPLLGNPRGIECLGAEDAGNSASR